MELQIYQLNLKTHDVATVVEGGGPQIVLKGHLAKVGGLKLSTFQQDGKRKRDAKFLTLQLGSNRSNHDNEGGISGGRSWILL